MNFLNFSKVGMLDDSVENAAKKPAGIQTVHRVRGEGIAMNSETASDE